MARLSTARDFLRFSKVLQHLACLDRSTMHGNPFGINEHNQAFFFHLIFATRRSLQTVFIKFSSGLVLGQSYHKLT